MTLTVPPAVAAEIEAGALIAVSHSGGKDSHAMTILLRRVVPHDQLLVVHASLGRLEWPGTLAHIQRTTAGLPLVLARAATEPLAAVRRRRMWPSPALRWCTSDWKRSPIERELRRYLKARPRFGGRVVSCMGTRADESARRAKQEPLKRSVRNERAGRRWLDWLPIHGFGEAQVFETIRAAGERPHWVYRAGLSRCSCRLGHHGHGRRPAPRRAAPARPRGRVRRAGGRDRARLPHRRDQARRHPRAPTRTPIYGQIVSISATSVRQDYPSDLKRRVNGSR